MSLLTSTITTFDTVTVPTVTPERLVKSTADPAIVNDPQSRFPATAIELKTPVPPICWYRLSATAIVRKSFDPRKNELLKIGLFVVGGRDIFGCLYIVKKKLKKFPKNEHFESPFRMCIESPSGSGKSNAVLYIIALLSKCFAKIVICTKTNKTLYDHLKDTIDNVEFF
ncbi:hypothetical protein L915_07535 [Phytophthora nicotianae]|uniref:Uncharacterized protein n=1 Tax=Phytophthora nicotianae TaxID=4792 RepID=W2GYT3_PHYNI|nr:hypothetical protein L915_07535 [Phytophthora nicotianae]